jgi:hypothetical protein
MVAAAVGICYLLLYKQAITNVWLYAAVGILPLTVCLVWLANRRHAYDQNPYPTRHWVRLSIIFGAILLPLVLYPRDFAEPVWGLGFVLLGWALLDRNRRFYAFFSVIFLALGWLKSTLPRTANVEGAFLAASVGGMAILAGIELWRRRRV